MSAGMLEKNLFSDGLSKALRKKLLNRTQGNESFWSFDKLRSRSGSHALFQYPAMMVPELQGALLDDLLSIDDGIKLVYDPFSGSGTVMLESLYRGLDFHGSDINPLAVLLCEVKANPPSRTEALQGIREVISYTIEGEGGSIDFPGVDKWFESEVKFCLEKLKAGILSLGQIGLRRFLWICLSETVRLVSNSRTSTFKLHSYSSEDIRRRVVDAVGTFKKVSEKNANRIDEHWFMMDRIVAQGKRPSVTLYPGSVSDEWIAPEKADVLMTSPPYGDNKTTVPYGQYSYLPLRCIETADIPGGFDDTLLDSTSKIDSLSLGGSMKNADSFRDALCSSSPSFKNFISLIEGSSSLRKKVLSFSYDYMMSLSDVNNRLKEGAFCFYTLGERKVGGKDFPLVKMTKEFLENEGHEVVTLVERTLPGSRKRMALKNNSVETMGREWILVTRCWRSANDRVF